jgi:NAD(P)-dependent dehydrogenase (short-subunit alcohol dehydrogenase family)
MERRAGAPVIAITGCDTGIGEALCRRYLEAGYIVVAGYLQKPPAPLEEWHRVCPLDMRSETSIGEFAAAVKDRVGSGNRLAAVVQNAGMVSASPLECLPLAALREVFEVNYFGLYSLTQKLVPELIADGGRLALVGSMAGRVGMPFFSPYVSSKYAVEGLAESLRRELGPLGVKVILFEPAAVVTPIWDNSWARIKKDLLPLIIDRYRDVFLKIGNQFVANGNAGMGVEEAVDQIIRAIHASRPRARYIISKSLWLSRLEAILPSSLMDRLIIKAFNLSALAPKRPPLK